MTTATRFKYLQAACLWVVCNYASAEDGELKIKTAVDAFYTDDVALFSVSRRLSLKDDPTQPIVDRPGRGGDFVYEPQVEVDWMGRNSLGELGLSLDAGAYLFTERTEFNHGLFEILLSQSFAGGTKLSLLYNAAPDLYLGQNLFREAEGEEFEADESLTNHYWSVHIDQDLNENVTMRLLGRYGLRIYDAPFQHRDTEFWTVGPHLEWRINPAINLLLGYHYESGYASQHKAAHFPDDVSYINHLASMELSVRLLERLTADFIFDYEKNDFTTGNRLDEHYGAAEIVYQGEIELSYELSEHAGVKLGWQHGSRQLTTEGATINNNNIWLGVDYAF